MSEVKPRSSAGSRSRKRLAPSEKYELFVQVLTQQATQREAAAKFGVDRSTVVHVCKTAKQGALDALAASVPGRRPGQSPEQAELAAARAEIVAGDLVLAIGTSLTVHPVAGLVPYAVNSGARLVIVNAEPTPYDAWADAVVADPIEDVLPRLVG